MAHCINCNDFNPYQQTEFICYRCRSGWVPPAVTKRYNAILEARSMPTKASKVVVPCNTGLHPDTDVAVELWVDVGAGLQFNMCKRCIARCSSVRNTYQVTPI